VICGAVVTPSLTGRGLAGETLLALRRAALESGLSRVVAPVRPTTKARYPLTPIETFMRWRRADGTALDPWIRTHERLDAEILAAAPVSQTMTGTVAQWEKWTGLALPESGEYVIPDGLGLLSASTGPPTRACTGSPTSGCDTSDTRCRRREGLPGGCAPRPPLSALKGPRPQTPDGLDISAPPAFEERGLGRSPRRTGRVRAAGARKPTLRGRGPFLRRRGQPPRGQPPLRIRAPTRSGNSPVPVTSTAHQPQPRSSRQAWKSAAQASLCSRVRRSPRCSRTSGSAFMAAQGARSEGRQERRTRR